MQTRAGKVFRACRYNPPMFDPYVGLPDAAVSSDLAEPAHALHPHLAPLALLLGTWRGEGRATYPTLGDIAYGEETVLAPVPGRPLCWYEQRTWALADERPLHDETGWWRVHPDGQLELLIAAATGLVEVDAGSVVVEHGVARAETSSISVVATPTGPEAGIVTRSLASDGATLRYEVHMEVGGQPLDMHLLATLRRVQPGGESV